MSFREKLEKLGRGLPRILEPDNSLKHTTVPPSAGLPNPSGLRLLTPIIDTRLSDSVPQSATSLFSNSSEDNNNMLTRVTKNPAASSPTTLKVNGDDWAGVKAFQKTLDPDIKSPLKPMADEFIRCIELFERAIKGGGEQKKLRKEFDELFYKINLQYSNNPTLTMTPSVESLCRSICSRLRCVRDKSRGGSAKWYLRITGVFEPQQVLLDYRRIRGDLQRLSLNLDTKRWQVLDDRADGLLLETLRPSHSARYDSSEAAALHRGACTAGTRTGELGKMLYWVYDTETNSTYWLSGMAGTGKTTIIYSLCEQLDNQGLLGASFFCSRSLSECREVDRIMKSIAYQLAQFSYPFRCALLGILKKDPELFSKGLQTQFQRLITSPLVQVQETMPEGLVVAIDALDECADKDSTTQILETLLNRSSHLPVKFIASSRPESMIQKQMDKQKGKRIKFRLVLHEIDEGIVKTDIETYFRQALKPANPSDQQILTLVQQAGTLFIYAATIVRYVTDVKSPGESHARLDQLLSNPTLALNGVNKEIDALYTVILQLAIDDSGASNAEKNDIKRVLGIGICAQEPVTVSTISFVLGMAESRVYAALQALTSVLLVLKDSQVVMALHASFPDYLMDPKRSNKFCCRRRTYQQALALGCFRWIRENKSQFNICGLESPYLRDSEIPDLESRVDIAISWELYYACRHWAAHLGRTQKSAALLEQFSDFLSIRLMVWMEVMNLKHCMHTTPGILWCAEEWAKKEECSPEIVQLIHGAWRFATDYQLGAAKLSTLHIYHSSLPFLPSSSPLWKYHGKSIRGPIFSEPIITQRKIELFGNIAFDEAVKSIEWSPDGTRIVGIVGAQLITLNAVTFQVILKLGDDNLPVDAFSISPDSTRCATVSKASMVHVWDLRDGNPTLGPLEAKMSILALRYSSNGALIALATSRGLFDYGGIRIIDARTGDLVLGPLGGNIYPTPQLQLLFSPNNSHIALRLAGYLRVWDVRTGEGVPINKHINGITSFSYSPDGTRIASGRVEGPNIRIRVYDLEAKQFVLALKFHSSEITSLVYSPDGSRIVSGSYDGTVYVWDSHTGQIHSFLTTNVNINSISLSPDGTRIVTCSHDRRMRIWDVRIDQRTENSCTVGPLSPINTSTPDTRGSQPHNPMGDPSFVKSVFAFPGILSISRSPDGLYTIATYSDGTLRIWTATTKKLISEFKAHNKPISSVFYSSDGNHIISRDQDDTICVWCHLTNTHDEPHEPCRPILTLKVNQDRWITDDMSRLIIWVPPDISMQELLDSERAIPEIIGIVIPSLSWDNILAKDTQEYRHQLQW